MEPEELLWSQGHRVSWSGFEDAIKEGDSAALRLFFEAGFDSWTPTWHLRERRFLRTAIDYGHADVFCLLVEAGADFRGENSDGNYLIHSAAREGRPQILVFLLDQGQNPNAAKVRAGKNSHVVLPPLFAGLIRAYNPSLSASRKLDYYSGVAALLDRGANPNWQDPRDGMTPLSWVVLNKDHAMASLLVRFGADPGIPTEKGETAISLAACRLADINLVEILLQGIDDGPRSRLSLVNALECSRNPGIRGSIEDRLMPLKATSKGEQ
tara:strand:+ start:14805 stop:15608 length:804 start_codon:yes stop_codon:yes gene_type:complete